MDERLKKIVDGIDIIVVMKFGSHLYGTYTPESDVDYKGIYMPTSKQICTCNIPKSISFTSGDDDSKNGKDDIDIELYSLNYFLELALKGETIAIDMIHCGDESVVDSDNTWEFIRNYRDEFYTNNLKGFVGYCRKQAAKYGVKGSRITIIISVLEYLRAFVDDPLTRDVIKMSDVWDDLPEGDHIHKIYDLPGGPFYQVAGKKYQTTSKVAHVVAQLDQHVQSYGHRALKAAENKGIDWKAVSHALRYAYQIRELFESGDIIFPLKQAEFLLDVKMGRVNYLNHVAPILDELMNDIEELSAISTLPSKPNRIFWMNFLQEQYEYVVK